MHKITKGIKKKIKSKKGHKGDDLFDPAELEKYRKEKEQKEAAAAAVEAGGGEAGGGEGGGEGGGGDGEAEGGDAAPKEEDEEWQRFKLLTAGVDSVLKKTQGDLDRIKSTSYFQRKKPGVPERPADRKGPEAAKAAAPKEAQQAAAGARPKRWVGFEEGAPIDEPPPPEEEEEAAEEEEEAGEAEAAPEEEVPEEEEEEDPGEDIFDTSYVDVVASGEVKLAYIPESPTEEGPDEDDPFDTSIAEKVIGPEPPKGKKQRQLVSLGCAVEVLTGRVDRSQVTPVAHPAQSSKKRRVAPPRRPEDVDLFALDDDPPAEEAPPQSRRASGVAADPFGVLDELPDTTPVGEALTTVPPQPAPKKEAEGQGDGGAGEETVLKDLVAEFDIIGEAESAKTEEELIFGKKPEAEEDKKEDEHLEEDEFAALAAESAKRSPAPPNTLNLETGEELQEDDPFDTSAAAGVLGELPATPQRAPPCRPPRPVSSPDVDVLLGGGKNEDLGWEEFDQDRSVAKGPPPLRPAPPSAGPPPRPSQPPARPPPITGVPNGGFVPSLGQPPLTFSETAIQEITRDLDSRFEDADDPFDTTFAEVAAAPGRAELRLIESEILGDVEEEEEESFDPRAGERSGKLDEVQSSVTIHISLPREEEGAEQVFGQGETEQRVGEDLFDSAEESQDGAEFVPSLQLSHRDLLGGSTTDLSKLGHDPISPDEPVEQSLGEELEEYIDPFDTSIVDPRIAPGKAELKILEKELLGEVDTPPVAETSGLQRTISDPDFDPRGEEEVQPEAETIQLSLDLSRPDLLEADTRAQEAPEASDLVLSPSARPDLLSVGEAEVEFSKPLTPQVEKGETISEAVLRTDGVDPFDTTFAENILPGKAELRIIESELIGQPDVTAGTGLTRSVSDPDFDPRGAAEESRTPQGQADATAAATVQHRRFSDVTALGGSRPVRPPTTLPLQRVVNSCAVPTVAPTAVREIQPDLLAVEEEAEAAAAKPLSPARKLEEAEDPFDTSAVSSSVLQPGKAELKALESELIGEEPQQQPAAFRTSITAQVLVTQLPQPPPPVALTNPPPPKVKPPDLLNLAEAEEAPAGPKPLTPLVEGSDFPSGEEYYDPFDTSIAEGIGPGRTELKLLESELIGQ